MCQHRWEFQNLNFDYPINKAKNQFAVQCEKERERERESRKNYPFRLILNSWKDIGFIGKAGAHTSQIKKNPVVTIWDFSAFDFQTLWIVILGFS